MKKLHFIFALLFLAYTTNAKTIYVSTSGNDATGDGTQLNPYKTITKGLNMVDANGDVIMLAAGTYSEGATCVPKVFNQSIIGESAMNTIVDFSGLTLGFWVDQNTALTFKNLTLQNANNTTNDGGSAIWMHQLTGLTLDNVIVKNNTAKRIGGAICFYGNSLTITNCLFENNYVKDGGSNTWSYGGALFVEAFNDNVNVSIKNATFLNNKSDIFGSVITFWKPRGNPDNVLIENCVFYQNKQFGVIDWGGALHFQSTALNQINAKLVNNTFYDNESGVNLAKTVATVLAQGAKTYLTLANNLISNSSGTGVTMYVLDGSAPFTTGKNNIIRTIGGGLETTDFATNAANNNYVVWDNPMVTGVLLNSSLTDNSSSSVFKVPYLESLSGSTTINNGINSYGSPEIIPTGDIRGAATFGTKDIGAFEFGGVLTFTPTTSWPDFKIFVKDKNIELTSVNLSGKAIRVYNTSGQCIRSFQVNSETINFRLENPGVYIFTVSGNEVSFSQKVILI